MGFGNRTGSGCSCSQRKSQSSQSFSLSEGSSTLKIAFLVAVFLRFRFDALPANPVRLTGICAGMNRFCLDSRASGDSP